MSEPLTPWPRGSGNGPRRGGLPWFTWIALAALITPAGTDAQATTGSVTGRVVEADGGEPVVAAAVRLMTAADSTVVTSAATGYRGHFRIAGITPGRYFLEISRLGYAPRVTVSFEVEDGVVYDLGVVELPVRAFDLEPISVVEARPVVVYEPDRTSYLLEGLPSAEGGTISDALRDLPELDVDMEGNVALRGERPAIWLNGRPAPVTGQSLAQFLEQFPADLIERIEVIENPGSEFDAEGAGGIINIVLREGADLGLSGQLFAHGDTRGNAGLGGRATLQRGDWVSVRDERTANARVLIRMDDPDDPAPDSESRGLDQEQRLHAAYFNVQRELAGRLALQVGLRAEHVAWDLGFPGAAPVDGSYFDVFPSVNLSWQHARAWRVRVSYSQRIGRPPTRILDPTDRSRDPLEHLVGNPGIEPRYSHRFHLNASWSGHLGTLALRPYVSRTVNS